MYFNINPIFQKHKLLLQLSLLFLMLEHFVWFIYPGRMCLLALIGQERQDVKMTCCLHSLGYYYQCHILHTITGKTDNVVQDVKLTYFTQI